MEGGSKGQASKSAFQDAEMQARKNGFQAQADQRQIGWFGHGSEIEITYEIQACVADMCDHNLSGAA
jgi:hypothetical protein